jgi:hypothetical protein
MAASPPPTLTITIPPPLASSQDDTGVGASPGCTLIPEGQRPPPAPRVSGPMSPWVLNAGATNLPVDETTAGIS